MRGDVPEGAVEVPLGRAEVRRHGNDVTIVAYSIMARHAERAAEELAAEHGIEVELDRSANARSAGSRDDHRLGSTDPSGGRLSRGMDGRWVRRGGRRPDNRGALRRARGAGLRVGARSSHIPFSPPLERAVVPQHEEIVDAVRANRFAPAADRLDRGFVHGVRRSAGD